MQKIIEFFKSIFQQQNEEKVKLQKIIKYVFEKIGMNEHLKDKIIINYNKISIIDLSEIFYSLCKPCKVITTNDEMYIIYGNPLIGEKIKTIIIDLINLEIKKDSEEIIIPGKYGKIKLDIEKGEIKLISQLQHDNILYVSYVIENKRDDGNIEYYLCIKTDYMLKSKCIKIIDKPDEIIINKIMPIGNVIYFVIGFMKNNKLYYSYYTFDGQRVLVKEIDEFGNVKFSGKYIPSGDKV